MLMRAVSQVSSCRSNWRPTRKSSLKRVVAFARGSYALSIDPFRRANLSTPASLARSEPEPTWRFAGNVVRELGGFDDALDTGAPLPGGGDLDMFYRIIRAGHALVYEPSALVFHRHRRKMKELRRQYWSWGLGFMSFAAKSYRTDPPARRHFRRVVNGEFKRALFQLVKSLLATGWSFSHISVGAALGFHGWLDGRV